MGADLDYTWVLWSCDHIALLLKMLIHGSLLELQNLCPPQDDWTQTYTLSRYQLISEYIWSLGSIGVAYLPSDLTYLIL